MSNYEPQPFSTTFEVFRQTNLLDFAVEFAASENYEALEIMFTRHAKQIIPFRFSILENIPETVLFTLFFY